MAPVTGFLLHGSLLLHTIDLAAREGVRTFDLMPGGAEYKYRLASETIETVSLEGLASRALPRAWQGLRALKRRVQRAIS